MMAESSRSAMMARIQGKDTSPELLLRSALWNRGHRYRLHYVVNNIRPDLVFLRQKISIFIDGCFWHGCPEHYVRPRSRPEFWGKKLRGNIERDRRQTKMLEDSGWIVLRFWEHQIFGDINAVVDAVVFALSANEQSTKSETRWVVVEVRPVAASDNLEKWYIENLRNPKQHRIEKRYRSTKKW